MGLFDVFKKTSDDENKALSLNGNPSNDIIENAADLLADVSVDLTKSDAVKLSLSQLGVLGGGIASMVPSLRKVSATATYTDNGLYRCVFPKGIKGYLATAHNDGLQIGTILTDKGITAQARWIKAGPQTVNLTGFAPINPATLMMSAAIIVIEQKLKNIIEMEKQILSFFEEDKESQIEGDLKTLTTIIKEFKFNWDSDTYTSTHHQIAADIKRTAEQNMIFYQKQVADLLRANTPNPALTLQQAINSEQVAFLKTFKYYRLSLYTFGFASFVEVMLQGKYNEGYIQQIRQEITERSEQYQKFFEECYNRLEKLTVSSVQHNVLKGLGSATKAVGNFIGSIPVLKDGQVDEWLIENGSNLEQSGEDYGRKELKQFEAIGDSGSRLFIDNLSNVNRLFNQTREIYVGHDTVYLVR